jgi:hypothetical protein
MKKVIRINEMNFNLWTKGDLIMKKLNTSRLEKAIKLVLDWQRKSIKTAIRNQIIDFEMVLFFGKNQIEKKEKIIAFVLGFPEKPSILFMSGSPKELSPKV